MKAKDLRIGNIVHYKLFNHYITIRGMAKDSIWVNDSEDAGPISIVHIEPIPLTEEWLVKFGFQRSSKTKYHIKGMTLVFHINSNQWTFPYVHELGKLKRINYVHQLQNLYHALTGEELTIK